MAPCSRPPGLERHFALEGWADFQPELWDAKSRSGPATARSDLTLPPLLGIEADPAIADQARDNVEAAGLSGVIRICTGTLSSRPSPRGLGCWSAIPPTANGSVMKKSSRQLYRELGNYAKGQQAKGWQLWLLSGNAAT